MATDLASERNAAQQLDNTRMMLERQVSCINLGNLYHALPYGLLDLVNSMLALWAFRLG